MLQQSVSCVEESAIPLILELLKNGPEPELPFFGPIKNNALITPNSCVAEPIPKLYFLSRIFPPYPSPPEGPLDKLFRKKAQKCLANLLKVGMDPQIIKRLVSKILDKQI